MGTVYKVLGQSNPSANTATTLYTVPGATTTVISSIVLANTAASTSTATISFDGVVAVPTVSIAANTVIEISLKQVLNATKTITGGASTTAVSIHISGVEIA